MKFRGEDELEVEIEFEDVERYLAVLSRYGENLLRAPLGSGEFSKNEINRFTGLEADEEIDFLEMIQVLEPKRVNNRVFYQLNPDYEDLARHSMAYISDNYGRNPHIFVEEFGIEDIQSLNEYGVDLS